MADKDNAITVKVVKNGKLISGPSQLFGITAHCGDVTIGSNALLYHDFGPEDFDRAARELAEHAGLTGFWWRGRVDALTMVYVQAAGAPALNLDQRAG